MCLLIAQQKNSAISKKILKKGYENNPNGAGIAHIQNQKIAIEKFFSFEEFYTRYSQIQNKQMIIHFRLATSGKIDATNCHPFVVNENLCFAHNGVFGNIDIPEKDRQYSDTYIFNRDILQKLPPDFLQNKAIESLILEFLGTSKLVFMDATGNFTIYNHQLGNTDDKGNWFSNRTYESNHFSFFSSAKGELFDLPDIEESYDASIPLEDYCIICGDFLYTIQEQKKGFCNKCHI